MELFLGEKLLSALHFASIAHRNQLRKGPSNIPYISHPAAVGMILWKAGYSEDVATTGILHDVIEDTEFGYDDIKEKFGEQIADWVQDVSENADLPYEQKKIAYLDHLETAPEEAKAVSGADLLANRYSMIEEERNGFRLWKLWERQIEFDLRRLSILSTANLPFFDELSQVTKKAHEFYRDGGPGNK